MKIVQINTFPYKATGSIMMNIHEELCNQGDESYATWGRGRDSHCRQEIVLKDDLGVKLHGIYTRITDRTGFASKKITVQFIKKLKEINPDIVHLHNIHGYYINIEILFDYLKRYKKKIVWTFHDCWPMTGHCAYFDMVGCTKWKTGCYDCKQLKTYPSSLVFDSSKWNWEKKNNLFSYENLTVVTPCNWLNQLVRESSIKYKQVITIYNGIDTAKYYRIESDILKKYGIEDKKVVLGVASEWTERKGLRDFIDLSKRLDNSKYTVLLVGLTKKQIAQLPEQIIGLERTSNLQELLELYSSAYVFLNPTYEDNFPTTNLEAIACGTPVITYRTGGSPEALSENTGIVVEKGDLNTVIQAIDTGEIGKIKPILPEKFRKNNMINEYMNLYRKIYKE